MVRKIVKNKRERERERERERGSCNKFSLSCIQLIFRTKPFFISYFPSILKPHTDIRYVITNIYKTTTIRLSMPQTTMQYIITQFKTNVEYVNNV